MAEVKVPCWEFMACKPEIHSTCPAYLLKAGRKCWYVAGTYCGKKVRGINALKLTSCKECKYYQYRQTWDK